MLNTIERTREQAIGLMITRLIERKRERGYFLEREMLLLIKLIDEYVVK